MAWRRVREKVYCEKVYRNRVTKLAGLRLGWTSRVEHRLPNIKPNSYGVVNRLPSLPYTLGSLAHL